MRPRGSKLQPHWQSAAVPAALHVEAEHAGGRRLLRGAGAHFVPAFGLPFQTKTTLDSLTAPRRTGHMDTHRAQNAHSPHVAPRVATLQLASVRAARVGTAWAVCSTSPYRCSSVWHRTAGYSDAPQRVLRRAAARRKRGNSTSWFRDTKGAWCGARLVYAWALGGANSLRTNVALLTMLVILLAACHTSPSAHVQCCTRCCQPGPPLYML